MVLPPTPSPTCYKDYCKDPALIGLTSLGLYKAKLGEIYQSWNSDVDPLSAQELTEELVMDMSQGLPGGILVMVTDPYSTSGVAKVLHNVRIHTGRDEHRGTPFAYVGDVLDQDIEIVKFDPKVLDLCLQVNIQADVDTQIQLLAADENRELAAEPDAAAVRANTAKTHSARGGMFIPAPLMGYVMDDPPRSAKQTLEVLVAAMRAMELFNVCEPLIDYLIYATTDHAAGASPDTVQLTIGEVFANPVKVARARRNAVLYAQLPTLRPTPNGQDPALHGLLGAMREVRDGVLDDLADRRIDRGERKAARSIEQKWNDKTVDRICKMCGANQTEDLPPLYHELAAHKKTDGTVRSVLQDAVEFTANALGIQHIPTVTVQHATALAGWVFFGAGNQSLGEGLMPFSVVPPNQVSATAIAAIQQAHHQNMDYNTVMTGSTSITSEDAQKLRSAKGYVPANFEEMIVQLTAYTCVLGAILGQAHPNVLEHQLAVEKLVVNQALLKQFVNAEFGSKLGAAKIVYYFQLRHRMWFSEQWKLTTKTTLPPPRLGAGFDTFATSYTITWLPTTSHVDLLQRLERSPATAASGRGSNEEKKDDDNSGARAGNGTGGSGSERKRVSNRNRDPRVMGETPLAKQIRLDAIADALARAGSPPATTNGKTRCLSWHLKGKCYNDCARKADHVVLPIEDADTLVEWCSIAYP
jgi:ribosome assembly protein YihI (activator of Der GTPase)